MIGFNVMNDPATRAGANAAIQRRALAVSGPLLLPGADLGIVARVPIFQRGRDNRETFWGFTAASMRLSQALARSRIAELQRSGFGYLCYVPGSAQQQPLTLAGYGHVPLVDAFQQPLKIQGAEIRLALYPEGGWFNKTRLAFDLFAVGFVSCLVGLFVNALESRQAVEQTLAEIQHQPARETTEQRQNQFDARLAKEAAATTQARQELEKTRASLQQAQQTVSDLQHKLQAAAHAEKENAAGVLGRLQQDQAAIADLQAHLDAATRSARENSEAGAAKLHDLETANQQLTARLAAAAHYEARVSELTISLQQAEAEGTRLRENLAAARLPTEPIETVAVESVEVEKPKTERRRKPKAVEETVPAPEESVVVAEVLAESATAPAAEIRHNGAEGEPSHLAESVAPVVIAEPAPIELTSNRELEEPAAVESEPPATDKPVKAAKRKKVRRVDQMDLFGGAASDDSKPAEPLAEPPPERAHEKTASLFDLEPAGENGSAAKAEVVAEVATATVVVNEGAVSQPATDSKSQAKALRRFVEEHSRAPEKIRDDLVQGDSAAAQKAIETLKDAADEAGAKEVHEAAAALLQTVRGSADPAAVEFLWADLQKAVNDVAGEAKPAPKPKAEKPKPAKPLPPPPPLDVAELRAAVGMIVPLLIDSDPGAKDCLKDNRDTFRSTFSPDGYVDFEQAVEEDTYPAALELLRKAVRKHGISA